MLLSRRASWIVSASAPPADASTATAAANAADGDGVFPRGAPFPRAVLSPLPPVVGGSEKCAHGFFFAHFWALSTSNQHSTVVKLWWP